ncbi:enoyl-CoA hydratase/isomerase family protein [Shimia sp. SDUM112013]|uniref:enoyl-CoA hydratase/isomerase family protein n=1 Tax=Shimia sp. SDUM112013 TaxID=3136160 RepID=UPI0032F05433
MAVYQHLEVTEQGEITTVTMTRTTHRNALDKVLMGELTHFAQARRLDTRTKVIILRGTDHYFSAGADLSLLADISGKTAGGHPDLLAQRQLAKIGPEMCKAWEELPQITIAAIEGHCVGGGVALALACDFRIVAEGTTMRLPEIPLGLNMSWQSIPRLVSLIGPARTKRMVIYGEALDAQTLTAWGLAEDCVDDRMTMQAAWDWAEKTVTLPALAVRMSKEAVTATASALHNAASFMDSDQFLLASLTEDHAQRVQQALKKKT